MTRLRSVAALAVAVSMGQAVKAAEETTGWLGAEDFKLRVAEIVQADRPIEDWLIPTDFAVRVVNGRAEYKADWNKNPGDPFSFQVHPVAGLDVAKAVVDDFLSIEPDNFYYDRLCLTRFARATDGANDYFLLFLTEGESAGQRCINLPAS